MIDRAPCLSVHMLLHDILFLIVHVSIGHCTECSSLLDSVLVSSRQLSKVSPNPSFSIYLIWINSKLLFFLICANMLLEDENV